SAHPGRAASTGELSRLVRGGSRQLLDGARLGARSAHALARPRHASGELRAAARRAPARRRRGPGPGAGRRVRHEGGPLMRAYLLLLAFAGCRQPDMSSVKAGELDLRLAIEPDPPAVGENELRVFVRDRKGKAIE